MIDDSLHTLGYNWGMINNSLHTLDDNWGMINNSLHTFGANRFGFFKNGKRSHFVTVLW
ncbi:hypothetical protein [Jeotgalibaca porci]|uniref:hypothetical protein n=1 Tax=Jeotgalibaca porci TaxID=1868793 RepID=UPI00359FB503